MPTRRDFIKDASLLAAAPIAGAARERAVLQTPPILAFVGTYSSGPPANNGRGIHVFACDAATGALTPRGVLETSSNPSALALGRTRTHLYAGNEVSNFENTKSGSVSAYAIDRATGQLTHVNTVSAQGAGPAHISVHPSGRYVLVANYGGGSIAVLPIRPDGGLDTASETKVHAGSVGAARATNAPSGSFAVSGHNAPHAHMIQADPSGRFVLATDLGLDLIFVWRFDEATGRLTAADPASVALPSGDGPRHFVFHPNGRWMYSVQEEASTVTVFDYDAANGRLTSRQTISTLPKGFAGTNFTSGILLSPDARHLYIANRLHDSIAWFAIGRDGRLTWAGDEWTRGDYPRSLEFDPSGTFLFSLNQRSDAITCFRVDRTSGRPTFTGAYTPVGAPSSLVFVPPAG